MLRNVEYVVGKLFYFLKMYTHFLDMADYNIFFQILLNPFYHKIFSNFKGHNLRLVVLSKNCTHIYRALKAFNRFLIHLHTEITVLNE